VVGVVDRAAQVAGAVGRIAVPHARLGTSLVLAVEKPLSNRSIGVVAAGGLGRSSSVMIPVSGSAAMCAR
jgi:hypothetical protein